METVISPLREQGLQALRAGDLDLAVERLARVVLSDAQDAEAQMYLGVAYSQKGLHAEARRALQSAADLRPHEARYYFNLGVALEGAGDLNGAVAAYRQTLQVNPGYGQARAKLQELASQSLLSAAESAGVPAPSGGTAGGQAPWQRGQSAPAAAAPAGPTGTVPCARCGQWSKPGLSCEWCSAPLRAAPSQPTAPWLDGSYGTRLESPAGVGSGPSCSAAMSVGEAFGRRFGALVIDQLIVYVLGIIAGGFVGFFFGFAAGVRGGQPVSGAAALGPLLGFGAGFVMGVSYYAGMLSACGQTLGKMAVGLRVRGPDGGNPGFWRAALRDGLGKPISGIVLCLGYFWMLWDGEQQTWHDKIAGTSVVRA